MNKKIWEVTPLILTASKPYRYQTVCFGDEKSHFYPTPCALWKGAGVGGCFLCSPEDLLNKKVNNNPIIIKSSLKTTFLWKPPESKKFAEIQYLARLFWSLKNILLSHPQTYLLYKISFNPWAWAVMIRVKRVSYVIRRTSGSSSGRQIYGKRHMGTYTEAFNLFRPS
jgi:hypothetical protein